MTCRKLRIWSHLLKKSLMESFIFCAVCILKIMLFLCDYSKYIKSLHCQYSHKLFNMILHCNRNVFFNSVSYFFGGLRCSVKSIRANKLDFLLLLLGLTANSVSVVNFQQISHISLVFTLLNQGSSKEAITTKRILEKQGAQ